MEVQQIRNFVHRVSQDAALRSELAAHPDAVIASEGFSPRVTRVITRLVPHLTLENEEKQGPSFWWYYNW